MVIHKITLRTQPEQIVAMPEGSEILEIQLQNGIPAMWYLNDPLNSMIEVKIFCVGTGRPIPEDGTKYTYLATIQDGENVWHFFMNHEE